MGVPLPWLVGLTLLPVYLLLASPTFYWLDSGELSAAAFGLGIAHPPGHPLAALLGRLLCFLPIGTLAFRVTLASAMAAAGAAALATLLSQQVLRRMEDPSTDHGSPRWVPAIASVATGLTVGLSYALAFQAVRVEVYALNLLLLLGAACLVMHWEEHRDRRSLLLGGLLVGLGLCNHHLLVVLALPGALAFLVLRRPRPGWRRAMVGLVVAALLGLMTLAYLPLRAARGPEVNWGTPTTVERFYWVVSAKAFQKAVDKAGRESLEHRAFGALFAVVGGLGPVAAMMALGGLYFLWRRPRTRSSALLLCGVAGGNLLSPITVGFDPLNPDAHGYLSVAVAFLSPGLAVFLALIGRAVVGLGQQPRLPALRGLLFSLLVLALPLVQGFVNLPRCDLRRHWAAEETARALFAQPRRTLVLTSYFETLFNAWAGRTLLDLRPDLDLFHRHFLPQPGYIDHQIPPRPGMQAMARRWLEAGRLVTADLLSLAASGPIAVEYDLDLRTDLVDRLHPQGLLLGLSPKDSPRPTDLRSEERSIRAWRQAIGPIDERETLRFVTYFHYLRTHYSCQRRFSALAQLHFDQALALAPASRDLHRLAAACALHGRGDPPFAPLAPIP